MSTTQAHSHLRSLYRRILRELPARPAPPPPPASSASTLQSTKQTRPSARSPLHTSIRTHLASPSFSSSSSSEAETLARRQELEQLVQYLKAQRVYGTLLERYNPGTGMDEEERVRLTARRVGMDLPVEYTWKPGQS